MNIKYSALHKSRPYTILFGKAPNGFTDYSKINPTLSTEKADSKLLDARLEFAQNVVIPQIAKLIKETQDKQHERFEKTHHIVKDKYPVGTKVMIKNVNRKTKRDPRYEGPFYIHGYSTNNSYILRDVPTHHLKIIRDDDSIINESNDELSDNDEEAVNNKDKRKKESDIYVIQAVVNHRGSLGNYEYLIHWEGHDDPKEFTWEPSSHFHSKLHINIYWARLQGTSKN